MMTVSSSTDTGRDPIPGLVLLQGARRDRAAVGWRPTATEVAHHLAFRELLLGELEPSAAEWFERHVEAVLDVTPAQFWRLFADARWLYAERYVLRGPIGWRALRRRARDQAWMCGHDNVLAFLRDPNGVFLPPWWRFRP
jgi:hypothetical protein